MVFELPMRHLWRFELSMENARIQLKPLLALALMLLACLAVILFKPKPYKFNEESVKLDQMVMRSFGDWREEPMASIALVSPEVQETLGKLYSETLSRTYVNSSGNRVMLSLAYGASQSRELQVHKPEVCYAAQGFKLVSTGFADLQIQAYRVPVMKIVAQAGGRIEPITYWIRSGDFVVRGWYEQNKARILNGFKGEIPDGLLVRVSSISDDTATAFKIQEQFLGDMLRSLDRQNMPMFLGKGPV